MSTKFNETDRLMREQRWEELMVHIHEIFQKYLFEASLHNLIYPYPPCTPPSKQAKTASTSCEAFFLPRLGKPLFERFPPDAPLPPMPPSARNNQHRTKG